MESEIWEQIEQLFHIALTLPAEDRYLFLKRECAGDASLVSEIESLIFSFEKESDFLDEPIIDMCFETIARQNEPNLSGTTIGSYELLEKAGSGGMGEVYKARDTVLNRVVALKFLPESLENDNAARRRLIKEAQAAAMLEHPNICGIYGIEQDDDRHFIVMQFIDGQTLAEAIDGPALSVEEFRTIAHQILSAVAFAHSHGIIHRDLKPGNIMLTGDGRVKVLDFGLAKVIRTTFEKGTEPSQLSQSGLIIGTVSYMSPEQLRGEKIDYRSDIFSAGIILYQLLAKQNPFNRKSQAETMAAILGDDAPGLGSLAPGFPKGTVELVKKCLHRDANLRYQSVAEILVDLDKPFLETAGDRRTKMRRRLFAVTLIMAIALVSLALTLLFSEIFRPKRSLAVLPISFTSPASGKELIGDWLTQGIIEKLSNLSDVRVKNPFVIANFKGPAVDAREAGKQLGVDAVFSGSIVPRDDSLFLTTKLIRVSDGFVVSENGPVKIDESKIDELQTLVVSNLLDEVHAYLSADDRSKLNKSDTKNSDAKLAYILGRSQLNRRDNGDIDKAIRNFNDATIADASYAKAWSGLSDAYLASSLPGAENPISPSEAAAKAKKAMERALDLDETLAETQNSLGLIASKYDWNWQQAEINFRTAIGRDPNFIPAHIGLLGVLNTQGRFEESLNEAQKIREIDPISATSDLELAKVYYRMKNYSQMDEVIKRLLIRFSNTERIAYTQSFEYIKTGRLDEAIAILEKIYKSTKESDRVFASAPLGFAYAKRGEKEKAYEIIANLDKFASNGYIPAQEKAVIYIGLGEFDKAFEYLNKSCAERFQTLPGFVTDPLVEEVIADSRFAAIKKCTNL